MSKRNGTDRHPPEQQAAEKLLQVLGAANTADAIPRAQALTQAVLSDPLVVTITIHRAIGRLTLTTNVSLERRAEDLRLLHQALLEIGKQIGDEMVKVAGMPPS